MSPTRQVGAPKPTSEVRAPALLGDLVFLGLVVGVVVVVSVVTVMWTGERHADSGSVSIPVALPGAPGLVRLAPGESFAETSVTDSGDLIVTQWIHADDPLQQVELALPQVPGGAPLAADQVVVTADGDPVSGPTEISARPASYVLRDARLVQIDYRLVGAIERSASVEGRALAVATTLDVRYAPRPVRETRVVQAPEVLSLACTSSGQAAPAPCGASQRANQWSVELTGVGVRDRVIAQVTLGAG